MDQKFTRAEKTSHNYQGQINGKTYVVPHSRLDIYNPKGYATPLRHSVVTSQHHVAHHNPNLSPEEVSRVHEHIKNLHGGQEPAKLEEESMLQEEIYHVWDHHGNKHEVSATSESDAKKKLVSGHVNGEQVPMTQWHKIKIQKKLEEKVLTPAETAKKESLVKSMKPKLQSFKERYGAKKGKSVLYAVATKQAKKLAEEATHKTGDGKKHQSLDAAKRHASKVHKKTGNIISVEPLKEDTKSPFRHHMDLVNHNLLKKNPDKKKARFHFGQAIKAHARGEEAMKSLKEEQLDEAADFMTTYKRNESQNRHTQNIVHLAKHFGTKSDQAEAKFYADELKKHGHQPHHEAAYRLHEKLWPQAVKAHEYGKASGRISEDHQQLDELHQSDYSWHKELGAQKTPAPGHAYHASSNDELHRLHAFHSEKAVSTIRTDPQKAKRHQQYADTAKQILTHRQSSLKEWKSIKGVDLDKVRADAKKQGKKVTMQHGEGGSLYKVVKEEHSSSFNLVKDVINEALTRKHFRDVASLIAAHPDAEERKKLAAHHAVIFAKSNPRFDHKRFYAAANADLMKEEAEQLDELKRSTLASYVGKAAPSLATHSYMAAKARGYESGSTHPLTQTHFGKEAEKAEKKTEKREKGIQRAAEKMK